MEPGSKTDVIVAARYPARLPGQVGDLASYTLAGELARPEALLVNKSRP